MRSLLEQEVENIFLWIPVAIAMGILVFFQLSFDPSFYLSFAILIISSIALWLVRNRYYLRIAAALIFFVVLGFNSALYRTESMSAPILKSITDEIWIEGDVADITFNKKNKRLLLKDIYAEYEYIDFPKFVRISLKSDVSHFKIGDRILVKAVLMPPPQPAMPDGFDFTRFAYFKQIGAIGYAVRKPRLLEAREASNLTDYLNSLRKIIAQKIQNQLSEPSASIATGLLIGDSSSISQEDFDVIRKSGIAHIIAISGMHIVVVVGIIFFVSQYCLSRFPNLLLRYNIKKISAVIAIFFSFIYLLLAGSPVSAQRAFMMSSLVLLAIVLDRNASPMRSIALSAIVILLVTPETIMSASLQMSYAACIALIASFDLSKNLFFSQNKISDRRAVKVIKYFLTLTFASLVAGMATAPFVVFHFNQFSTYSILTNMICVPLADFIIMPFGMIALVLMPLGIEKIALYPMGLGIDAMFNYAEFISNLPYSYFYIPSFTSFGIGMFVVGGLLLCFLQTKLRLIGVIPVMFGLVTINNHIKPDILIDRDAKIFAIQNEDGQLMVSSKAKARFIRDVWMQKNGENEVSNIKKAGPSSCTSSLCVYKKNNSQVALVTNQEDLASACGPIDLFINLVDKEFTCEVAKANINIEDLSLKGAHSIWIGDEIKIETVLDYRPQRLWNAGG